MGGERTHQRVAQGVAGQLPQLGAGADADLPDTLRRQGRQISAEAGEEQSVVLQQPQRVEAALLPRERRERRLQHAHRALDRAGIFDRRLSLPRLFADGGGQRRAQFIQSLSAARCCADDRRAERVGERGQVEHDALLRRFVQQIHAHDRRNIRRLEGLQHEVQAALQTGRIRQNEHGLRLARAEIVPRDLLLGGVGEQRVRPRQIDERETLAAVCKIAARRGDGFPRPVARVLPQPGEGVEHGGFSHVRVSRQSNDMRLVRHGAIPPEKSKHFDLHAARVLAPQRDDRAAHTVGDRVAPRGNVQSADARARHEAEVEHPAALCTGGAQRRHYGARADRQRVKCHPHRGHFLSLCQGMREAVRWCGAKKQLPRRAAVRHGLFDCLSGHYT